MTDRPYRFHRQGRSFGLAVVLGAWLMGLLILATKVQAAPWLIALLALPTLPGLYELAKNPRSGLELNAQEISWFCGDRQTTVLLPEISHLRADTRLDLSVRLTLILTSGEKLRIPPQATPPIDALEEACKTRNMALERHHFVLF